MKSSKRKSYVYEKDLWTLHSPVKIKANPRIHHHDNIYTTDCAYLRWPVPYLAMQSKKTQKFFEKIHDHCYLELHPKQILEMIAALTDAYAVASGKEVECSEGRGCILCKWGRKKKVPGKISSPKTPKRSTRKSKSSTGVSKSSGFPLRDAYEDINE